MRDVNGVKIAMLNYTYGLNGLSIPAGMEYTVDLMTDSTKDKIAADIAKAKEISDFVIIFLIGERSITSEPMTARRAGQSFLPTMEWIL